MILTDLRELKAVLEIDPDDTSEDKKLNFFIETASQWIEEFLDRPGLTLKARTEFYKGTGTQQLCLRSRPIPTPSGVQVWVDSGGFYGSVSGAFPDPALVYGTDFCVTIDQEDGSSRSAILNRIGALWPKPQVRFPGYLAPSQGVDMGSIKVTYTAGYTVDTLPAGFRFAANLLVAQIRHLFPLGFYLTSESYEERSVSYLLPQKRRLMAEVEGYLKSYRNWKW